MLRLYVKDMRALKLYQLVELTSDETGMANILGQEDVKRVSYNNGKWTLTTLNGLTYTGKVDGNSFWLIERKVTATTPREIKIITPKSYGRLIICNEDGTGGVMPLATFMEWHNQGEYFANLSPLAWGNLPAEALTALREAFALAEPGQISIAEPNNNGAGGFKPFSPKKLAAIREHVGKKIVIREEDVG